MNRVRKMPATAPKKHSTQIIRFARSLSSGAGEGLSSVPIVGWAAGDPLGASTASQRSSARRTKSIDRCARILFWNLNSTKTGKMNGLCRNKTKNPWRISSDNLSWKGALENENRGTLGRTRTPENFTEGHLKLNPHENFGRGGGPLKTFQTPLPNNLPGVTSPRGRAKWLRGDCNDGDQEQTTEAKERVRPVDLIYFSEISQLIATGICNLAALWIWSVDSHAAHNWGFQSENLRTPGIAVWGKDSFVNAPFEGYVIRIWSFISRHITGAI